MANYIGQFKKGMKVGKETHMDFELRQMTTADMLDAEMEAPTSKPLNYNAAMGSLLLVRVGTYEGPFTIGMIRALHPQDYNVLRDALFEVAKLGEE